jgi:hypothetical protein
LSRPVQSSRQRRLTRAALALVACLPCCTFPDFAVVLRAKEPGAGGDVENGGSDNSGSGAMTQGGGGTAAGGEPSGGSAGTSAGASDAVGGEPMNAAGAGGTGTTGGDVLFFDDFESGNADNWAPSTLGDWSVVSSGSSQAYKQGTKGAALRVSSAGDRKWTNVSVETRIKVITFGGTNSADLAAVYARFTDLDNYYYAALRADGKVALKARVGGSESPLGAAVDIGISTNIWYQVLLEVDGSTLRLSVDGELVQTATDASLAAGAIAVGENNATVLFDDVKVTAL